jgi:GT2 family glycosyltransferase
VSTRPAVSITVVLHNSEDALPDCLASIQHDLDERFAELIVVDNASPDGSASVAARLAPGARIIRSELNRGFAAGCNVAWPHVHGEYWLLLNPDIRVPPGGLRALVGWMDRHPSLGVASPDLSGDGGEPGSPGRALPSASLVVLELLRLHRLLPARTRGQLLRGPYWTGGDQLDAGWVPGAAMLARTAAVRSAGLLSEAFFMYGEDIEWCARMHRAGWGVGVFAGITFAHGHATSATRTWPNARRQLLMAKGWYDAIEHVRGPSAARAFRAAHLLALGVEALRPGRDPARREAARAEARVWRRVA